MFYFSLLWESLHSVLMDFLRGDFENHSPRVVVKMGSFFLTAFQYHWYFSCSIFVNLSFFLTFGSPKLLKLINVSFLTRQMLLLRFILKSVYGFHFGKGTGLFKRKETE